MKIEDYEKAELILSEINFLENKQSIFNSILDNMDSDGKKISLTFECKKKSGGFEDKKVNLFEDSKNNNFQSEMLILFSDFIKSLNDEYKYKIEKSKEEFKNL